MPSDRCFRHRRNSRAWRAIFHGGTRAIDLPDEAVPSHFLDVFGRPARNSACECERVDAPALGQTLELVSSTEIQAKLTADRGLCGAAGGQQEVARRERPRYLPARLRPAAAAPGAGRRGEVPANRRRDRKEAYASLLWSLLATNEFLFNH